MAFGYSYTRDQSDRENKLLKAFVWAYLRTEKARMELNDSFPTMENRRKIEKSFRFLDDFYRFMGVMRPDQWDEDTLSTLGFEEFNGIWLIPIPYVIRGLIDDNTIVYDSTHPRNDGRRIGDIPKDSAILDPRLGGCLLTSTPCYNIGVKAAPVSSVSFTESDWMELSTETINERVDIL